MDKKVREFWTKWLKADEMEQQKMVATLTGVSWSFKAGSVSPTLLNSYLRDMLQAYCYPTSWDMDEGKYAANLKDEEGGDHAEE